MMTTDDCQEWLINRTINPRTRRKIKPSGPVYKQLQKECEDNPSATQPPGSSAGEECEEWLKDPSVNPRTRRKIKPDGPVYKQLQRECGVPSAMTIVPDVNASCSKIEVASLPTTLIEPKMDVSIPLNNDARVKKNEYLSSLKFARSNNEGDYLKAFGNVFRKVNNRSFNFFNSMIKYVPNFVYVFNDLVTEPYIDLDNDNLILDKTMLFDLVMIQITLNLFPNNNVQLKKDPKLCALKCDQVTCDLVTINGTKYYRPHSQCRYCFTPDSYIVSNTNAEETDFLDEFLKNQKFTRDIKDDLKLVEYIKLIEHLYLHHGNRVIKNILRQISLPDHKDHKADNTFPFPLKREKDTFYFNVTSVIETEKNIENFLNITKYNFNLRNKEDVERMGLDKLPFALLFHPDFNPEQLTIDPSFVLGPYVVKYNPHKLFKNTNYVYFVSVSSYIDPLFFEMFQNMRECTFLNSSDLSNSDQINLRSQLATLSVIDINPDFIFNVNADSIRSLFFDDDEHHDDINEASNIDLSLFEAFYKRMSSKPDTLTIRNFNTVAFPESFAFLESTLFFRFIHCNITSFHPSLFTTRFLDVNFEDCNLSVNSVRSFADNIGTIPIEQRPRITYSLRDQVGGDNLQLPIKDIIELIFALDKNTSPPLFQNITCEGPLTAWLNRIYNDSSTTIVRQLIPHIIEMLYEMERNSEFMEESCNIVEGATATCGDRMIMSILYVSLQFKTHILANQLDKVEEIADFLVRGPFIMSELEKIARAKINTLYVVDEIEVYLGYPIKLRDRFNIPIETRDMLYYACSSISRVDLANAVATIETKLRNKTLIADFLSTQPLWTKIVYARNPDIFEDVNTLQDNLLKETKQIIAPFNYI